ncbi:MAG: hydroxyethylthiazole kinase [Elusimicrobiota bacterium]
MEQFVWETLVKVRAEKPLVHHLTNWVTIYDCANIVKVFGASPVMAHAKEEVSEMAGIASAVVLNIGTLTPEFVDAMVLTAKTANSRAIPVVLDAVGAGATKFRDKKIAYILNHAYINIIKGNASEIARVAGENVRTKGVDSTDIGDGITGIAQRLAKLRNCTVVVTGETDIVTDNISTMKVHNGHPLMGSIVGTGCMAASVIGAFAAVEPNYVHACVAGLCCYEIAAELASKTVSGPGSFKERLFDTVYNLAKQDVEQYQKIEG